MRTAIIISDTGKYYIECDRWRLGLPEGVLSIYVGDAIVAQFKGWYVVKWAEYNEMPGLKACSEEVANA